MDQVENKKTVDISPISKGKRILVFLGDFFINFMLAFVLFGVAITPLAKAITGYETKSELFTKCEQERIDILYENKLIFTNDDTYKYDQNLYMSYTYKAWLSYFVVDGSEEFVIEDTRFGINEENLVIKHYFKDIRDDENNYYSLFTKYNEKKQYFNIENKTISLKDEYKNQLKDSYNPKGEMSEYGKEIYDDIASYIFFALFGEVLNDIGTNDLTYVGATRTYNENAKLAKEIQTYHRTLLSISAVVAYVLSTIILQLVIPLVFKSKRTFTMMCLKVDRININDLNKPRKLTILVNFVYSIAFNFAFVMFLPISFVSFAYIFEFSMLVSFSVVSLLFALTSMFVLIFSNYCQTLSDKLTSTVLISEEDLNTIYKARGYLQ